MLFRSEQDFDWDAVKKSGNIAVHWAYKTHGGDRKGEDTAATWLQGKQSTRQCLGIIICDNESCEIVVRPHTRPTGIHDQLQKPCSCGAKLTLPVLCGPSSGSGLVEFTIQMVVFIHIIAQHTLSISSLRKDIVLMPLFQHTQALAL